MARIALFSQVAEMLGKTLAALGGGIANSTLCRVADHPIDVFRVGSYRASGS